jgi:hypothetical protein
VRHALAVIIAVVADRADARCHEPSRVLGYPRCSAAGWWAAQPMGYSWETGPTVLQFDARSIEALSVVAGVSHNLHWVAPAISPPVDAVGGGLLVRASEGRLHFVIGWDHLAIVRGPALIVSDPPPGARAVYLAAAGAGAVDRGFVGIGVHATFGDAVIGAEALGGFRLAQYELQTRSHGDAPWQVSAIVEPRGMLDVWLSPSLSIGVRAGFDLLRGGEYDATLALGLHAFPYDGQR